MSNKKHESPEMAFDTDAAPNVSESLNKAGRSRRKFLGHLGKWGAAVTVFGLGAEPAMQVVFRRTVLSSALAAGVFSPAGTGLSLPPIPADQHPPPPPVPTGTIYWVATNGSDSNSGTEGSPFRTIHKARDMVGTNGGIYLKAGRHVMERDNPSHMLTFAKSDVIIRGAPGTTRDQVILEAGSGGGPAIRLAGTPNRNVHFYGITFRAGPNPADPAWLVSTPDSTINNWKQANWKEEIVWTGYIENCSFINCRFNNYFYRGILQSYSGEETSHNNEIAYCDFTHGGWHTAGADVSFGRRAGNTHVHHNELHGGVDGVVFHASRVGALIEYNHIYDQFREDGVDVKGTQSNPRIPGGGRITIRNNIIHDCYMQAVTLQRGAQKVDVYDNLVYDNGQGRLDQPGDGKHSSIWINGLPLSSSSTFGPTEDLRIWNNDIRTATGNGVRVSHEREDPNTGIVYPRNFEIENNRIYDNGGHGINIDGGRNLTVAGNIFSNNFGDGSKAQYRNRRLSHSVSDNNAVYLPNETFQWGAVSDIYTLPEWQSKYRKDLNSTTISGRFETPVPPDSPSGVQVTDARRFGDSPPRTEHPARTRSIGLLG